MDKNEKPATPAAPPPVAPTIGPPWRAVTESDPPNITPVLALWLRPDGTPGAAAIASRMATGQWEEDGIDDNGDPLRVVSPDLYQPLPGAAPLPAADPLRERLEGLASAARAVVDRLRASRIGRYEDQFPGHGHLVPGIWDASAPPALAGRPCEDCAAWNALRSLLSLLSSTGKEGDDGR